jgi:Na+/proline symporter
MNRGLAPLDLAVLAGYLASLTAVGLWAGRKVRSTEGYFMGERRFGKALMIAQTLGTGTHSDQAVSVAGAAYTIGLPGIWYQWLYLFCTPFYWLLAPILRRLRVVTTSDFFELRYGRPYAAAYAVFSIYLLALFQGIAIKGTAVSVSAITGYAELTIALVVAGVFLVYGLAGGLVAAVVTDSVQGLLIIVLSFLLVPFGLAKVGGFGGLRHRLPAEYFQVFSPSGGELSAFAVLMLVVSALLGATVQPVAMASVASGKREMACRIGWTYGAFIKRLCTVGWTLSGVLAAALYPGLSHAERERAFGIAAAGLLPEGLAGLLVASMLATVLACCAAFMVDGAALFVSNLYKPFFAGHRSEGHYLRVARWSSLGVSVLGFSLGMAMPSVVSALVHFVTILPFVGIPFWAGVMWRGANRYGAWISTASSAGVFFALKAWGASTPAASLTGVVCGIAAVVAASRIGPPEPAENLDRILHNLELPAEGEHA